MGAVSIKGNLKMECNSMYRILIVEDERSIADGIRAMLEMAGLTAECAYDMDDALERVPLGWDAVLLDVNLPYGQGRIKGASTVKSILGAGMPEEKVVVFTGYDDQGKEIKSQYPKMSVVSKPRNQEAINAVIDRAAMELAATAMRFED